MTYFHAQIGCKLLASGVDASVFLVLYKVYVGTDPSDACRDRTVATFTSGRRGTLSEWRAIIETWDPETSEDLRPLHPIEVSSTNRHWLP